MSFHALDGLSPVTPAPDFFWVAPNALLIGKVRLEADVGIWFGSVLRGDNEWITIGRGTNIQDQCIIHTDMGAPATIGAGCTIGHRAVIHGCTIGENTLVGMGAMILNRAVIGKDCLIGAGALIPEGKVIPDGSLVIGMPGKVVRPLEQAEIEANRQSAASYVANARRFAKGMQV